MSKNPVLAANIEVANMSGEGQDASQQGTNDVVRNYHDSQYQEVWLQDTRMFVGTRNLASMDAGQGCPSFLQSEGRAK